MANQWSHHPGRRHQSTANRDPVDTWWAASVLTAGTRRTAFKLRDMSCDRVVVPGQRDEGSLPCQHRTEEYGRVEYGGLPVKFSAYLLLRSSAAHFSSGLLPKNLVRIGTVHSRNRFAIGPAILQIHRR